MKQGFILPFEVETNYIYRFIYCYVHVLMVCSLFPEVQWQRWHGLDCSYWADQGNETVQHGRWVSQKITHRVTDLFPKKSRILFPFILPLDWITMTGILSSCILTIPSWCSCWQYIFHGPLCLTAYEQSHPSWVGSGFWNP